MAIEVRHFTATCPAGRSQAAPAVIAIRFPPRQVAQIDWRVPHGPMGVFGWRLTMGGVQVFPSGGDAWVLANDEHGTWYPDGAPDSGDWQVTAYNTGGSPHSVYLVFHLNLAGRAAPLAQLIPPHELSSAPDLSHAGPPIPGRR